MAFETDISGQQRALGDLQRARAATSSWSDDQRRKLDERRLSALEIAGREVLTALSDVSKLVASADKLLAR